MAEAGSGRDPGSEKGKAKVADSPAEGGEAKTWVHVVQGGLRRPLWSSPTISEEEVEELRGFFTAVLDIPLETVADLSKQWAGRSLLVRSLGRRVSSEALQREFRSKLRLGESPEVFPLAEEHSIVRFGEEEACNKALLGGPWVVSGQLLAVEEWRPRFNPSRSPVSKALVWLRLPFLPAEFWSSSAILAIAAKAGRPVEVDSFTDHLTRMGYARVKVEIDAFRPLLPGVLVRAGGEPFWQQFQFENLTHVCFSCGLIGHLDSDCMLANSGASSSCSRPRLGPWVVASRIWQPWSPPHSGGSSSRFGSSVPGSSRGYGPGSSVPSRTPTGRSPPASAAPSLVPSSESGGWRKPAKVARRAQQEKRSAGDDDSPGSVPGPLALIPVPMITQSPSSEVAERAMPDVDALALKRGRSPSPEVEEDRSLALVAVTSGPPQRPKRSTKIPAKPRALPALRTPPSRGSEVGSSEPCMDHREVGEAGRGAAGIGESSALVLVPIGQADSWSEGAAGVPHAKPDLGGGRKKGKAPVVDRQGSGDCLSGVRTPKKLAGSGGQASPMKFSGVGGCSGSPPVKGFSAGGAGSSPGKVGAVLQSKGVAGPRPVPGPLLLEGSCKEGVKVLGGMEFLEGVPPPGEVARQAGGRGPGHCSPVQVGSRGGSGMSGGGRGRRGVGSAPACGRPSRARPRARGEGKEVEGSPGGGEGGCRVRSRSPVGLRQGLPVEQEILGEQGAGSLLGGTPHGERVARLRRAMLGAQSGIDGEEAGGGVGASHHS